MTEITTSAIRNILESIPESIIDNFKNQDGTLRLFDLLTYYYSQRNQQTLNQAFYGLFC